MTDFVAELCAERMRLVETLEGLTDDEFDHGTTLCEGWAPRDVLAHVVGVDQIQRYLGAGRLRKANEQMVAAGRAMTRADLLAAGRRAATSPSRSSRLTAALLLGDVAVHHQDVLRGLGRRRDLPVAVERAIFREGLNLGMFKGLQPLRHRLVPTTAGLRPVGRGPTVSGPAEAIGMWLAGRHSVRDELAFG